MNEIFDHLAYVSYKTQRNLGVTPGVCAKWYPDSAELERKYQLEIGKSNYDPGYYWVKYFQAWIVAEITTDGDIILPGCVDPIKPSEINEIGTKIPDNIKLKRLIKTGDASQPQFAEALVLAVH